jgi:nucleoside-diphosphate-sugar epimerase/1-acyl-sn-glycerol-3-phosphate acyltransferase
MARVMVVDERVHVADLLVERLRESACVELCLRAAQNEDGFGGLLSGGPVGPLREQNVDTVVYSPPLVARRRMLPDLEHAEMVFQQCAQAGVRRFVLLSSAAVYGASPRNTGFVPESRLLARNERQPLASRWLDLEALAAFYFDENSGARLAILRPAAVLVPGGADYFSRLFSRRLSIALPGHDPSLQLLGVEDLASAVRRAVEKKAEGIYNVAPDGVIPLRAALRLAKVRRLPVARALQRLVRFPLASLGLSHPVGQLEYIRYSWTISNSKIKRELNFAPRRKSAEALLDFLAAKPGNGRVRETELPEFDDFGMDRKYIAAYGRTLFKVLHDRYWRVEVDGINRVPREGRAVLVGIHRGFMPWDAVMLLHEIFQHTGRVPRFLIHPGLIKFPFLFNFHTKLGGIVACQENADWVLRGDELLGIFPEGIRGAFTPYRDAYRIGKFGRDEFVRMALRNRAPIIPVLTLGSAEIFPIIAKLEWRWWKRHTEWPFFPITPTWPLLPVPLPAKWHTQFLSPIHLEDRYPPETADDPQIVRAISTEVRERMQKALKEMLSRRSSIFFGSIFESRPAVEEKLSYEENLSFKEKMS